MKRTLIISALVPAILLAGTVTYTLSTSPDQVRLTRYNGFDAVELASGIVIPDPGKPCLPEVPVTLAIPATSRVTEVTVTTLATIELGSFNVMPAQPASPLSKPAAARVPPDPQVYSSAEAYPANPLLGFHSGSAAGFRLVSVRVSPVAYQPLSGRLTLTSRLQVRISFDENTGTSAVLTPSQRDRALSGLRTLAANPQDLERFSPQVAETDQPEIAYLIITNDVLAPEFVPFAEYRTSRGLRSEIRTVEWIARNYEGRDLQEKTRNLIRDYFEHRGLSYVLLAGDNPQVPSRRIRLSVFDESGDIPTDMYYGDLDYSWDSNHNNLFGEMADSVDLYADVLVGRASVDRVSQVRNFIAKVQTYEQNPATDYIKRTLLPSGWLWRDIGYHGKFVNDSIANLTPTGWTNVKMENPPGSAVVQDSFDNGFSMFDPAGHGNAAGVYDQDGTPIYLSGNASSQHNRRRFTIMTSLACDPGDFETEDCCAEYALNCDSAGCIGAMMNSRYGWGTPPQMGPSEKLCVRFYDFFIQKDSWMLGAAHARGKDVYASLPQNQQVWRWCFYDYNLMGDPAMGVWSDVPGVLVVTTPDSVPTGTSNFHANVASGGNPVNGAWVGLYKAGQVCTRAKTNSAGNVDILVSPSTPGWLFVTAYAQDKLPVTDSVWVYTATPAPYLVVQGTYVDDGGNHQLDPGETVDLYVTLKNVGNATATSVAGMLSEDSAYITVPDSTSSYGTMNAGDTSRGDRYQVTAAGNAPPGSQVQFTCHVTSNEGSWDPTFTLYVGVPSTPGAVVMTHDTGYCKLSVTALGSIGYDAPPSFDAGTGFSYPKAAASQLYYSSLALGTGAAYLVDRYYGNPAPDYNTDFKLKDSLWAVYPPGSGDERFRCAINDSGHTSPKGITVTQNSYMTAGPGYDDFVVLVYGIRNTSTSQVDSLYAGVFADFDIGSDPATNQASADTVRRTMSMRQASGDNPTAGVKILAPASFKNLSAIDHAIYVYPTDTAMTDDMKYRFLNGTIVQRNSSRDYDWSICASVGPFDVPAGQTYRCAFAFVGGTSAANFAENADSAQSWYDNLLGVSEHEGVSGARGAASLACVPNPFSRSVQIRYNMPVAGRVRAEVFDVSGRAVAVLADGEAAAGKVETVWKPANLANGVYLLKVVLPNGTVSQKLMLLR